MPIHQENVQKLNDPLMAEEPVPLLVPPGAPKKKKKPRRSKGDGGLYKREDGTWVGVVELPSTDGKRRRKRVMSRDRNDAIRKLKKLRADVDSGRIAVTATTSVEKWLERWLEIHRRKIRPTTYRSYEQTIRLHINPHIGSKRMDRLTPQHVRGMADEITSSRFAQLAHVVLQRALDDAEKEGMITRNVAKVADKPKHLKATRKPLTVVQAKQLLRSAIDTKDPFATRWAAALLFGGRQGELLGLQWDRVDLEHGVVDFAWQLQELSQVHGCGERHGDKTWPCSRKRPGWCPQRKWDLPRGFPHQVLHRSLVLTEPKTLAGTRFVPIPAPLWAMLEQHRLGADPSVPNPHNLVWHHDDGRPIGPRQDYENWQNALKFAGLPAAPLHVARHTTATLLGAAGVSEEIRMAILGHAGIAVTRSYSHVIENVELQRVAMDGALTELLAPPAV